MRTLQTQEAMRHSPLTRTVALKIGTFVLCFETTLRDFLHRASGRSDPHMIDALMRSLAQRFFLKSLPDNAVAFVFEAAHATIKEWHAKNVEQTQSDCEQPLQDGVLDWTRHWFQCEARAELRRAFTSRTPLGMGVMLTRLNEDTRQVFTLCKVFQMSVSEIAGVLQLSEAKVTEHLIAAMYAWAPTVPGSQPPAAAAGQSCDADARRATRH
jgi:DNA-directed RNA polymerase specialized sigma24 family protein